MKISGLFPWPSDELTATCWLLGLALTYTVVAVTLSVIKKKDSKDFSYKITTDAATFSLSVMLLFGVADPKVFDFIGGIALPAMISGIAGILFALRSLFEKA